MNKIINNSFFICATEQSGDNIGEKIIYNFKLIDKKKYIFDGVGGLKMAPLMNNQFYKLNDFKSIGIIEIIGSINKYLNNDSSSSHKKNKIEQFYACCINA